jgi:hypothetical protein
MTRGFRRSPGELTLLGLEPLGDGLPDGRRDTADPVREPSDEGRRCGGE